jgi:hypothetical protein
VPLLTEFVTQKASSTAMAFLRNIVLGHAAPTRRWTVAEANGHELGMYRIRIGPEQT